MPATPPSEPIDRVTRLTIIIALLGITAVVVAIVYGGFIVVDAGSQTVYRNPTAAMEPTLLIGDYFSVRPLRVGGKPKFMVGRGDVVIHEFPPDPTKRFVKRIVGMPGDTLAMRAGVLEIRGRDAREPYAWHAEPNDDPVTADLAWMDRRRIGPPSSPGPASRNNWGPIVVPPDSLFVLGDNRDNSLDSRYWGFLSLNRVVGIARRVVFSRDPQTGGTRWGRFGLLLE